jgi:hypothetical protein
MTRYPNQTLNSVQLTDRRREIQPRGACSGWIGLAPGGGLALRGERYRIPRGDGLPPAPTTGLGAGGVVQASAVWGA